MRRNQRHSLRRERHHLHHFILDVRRFHIPTSRLLLAGGSRPHCRRHIHFHPLLNPTRHACRHIKNGARGGLHSSGENGALSWQTRPFFQSISRTNYQFNPAHFSLSDRLIFSSQFKAIHSLQMSLALLHVTIPVSCSFFVLFHPVPSVAAVFSASIGPFISWRAFGAGICFPKPPAWSHLFPIHEAQIQKEFHYPTLATQPRSSVSSRHDGHPGLHFQSHRR